ncbi:MAG: hypothetical protein COS99_06705 [Candidatus Omnitrophica bacterium CG07_land_8_20_14_0_80_42_15]|uniref:General secretion pathway protein F n=1 Tax=Candidatus Aquitaenariimonas noxiae TaxID=1974741 RepID=A0A2J0KRL2_9BACT|nr:MAG: hypothetical protein COS99_06705 [Candidatus Omnitrophica bacterium CG07_land_8_20_14_0_80_42_15]
MPKYIYKAKKGPKDFLEGSINAETYDGAVNKLSRMGYFPISVEEEGSASISGKTSYPLRRKKIRLSDLSIFTRQLSELLGAGVPLLQSLQVLSRQTENKQLRLVIDDLSKTIRDGGSLSGGLEKYPHVFSNLYVNITKSGELGGKLEDALIRLSEFLDKEEEMISRVQQALAYPALMCTVGLGTILILMTVVIPRMVAMFKDMEQALPIPTLILITVSNLLVRYWWMVILGVFFIAFAIKTRTKTTSGKLIFDKIKLRIPIIGSLINKIEVARLSRTLATLLNGGIAILPAMDAVIDTVQNEVIKLELEKARQDIKDGASFGRSLRDAKHLLPYTINMISVGEESGKLENVLFKVASSYESQSDKVIRLLMTVLEPLLILVMGLIVGFIVISMLLPIFQFNIMVR